MIVPDIVVSGGGSGSRRGGARHDRQRGEAVRGDLDGADLPGLAVVAGGHAGLDVGAEAQGVDVVGVGRVQGDGDVAPGVGGDGAAVGLGALDRGAPALGLAIAGAQGRDDGAADDDVLRVILRALVILVVEGHLGSGVAS